MEGELTVKICTKCLRELPYDHFCIRRASADGFQPVCRECGAAYARAFRESNPPRKLSAITASKRAFYARAYRAAHPERIAACNGMYYRTHLNQIAANSRTRRARIAGAVMGPIPDDIKARLIEVYGPTCMKPGCESVDLTIDHIIPLSKGGEDTVANLQLLCNPCNAGKRDWHDTDYRPEGLTL